MACGRIVGIVIVVAMVAVGCSSSGQESAADPTRPRSTTAATSAPTTTAPTTTTARATTSTTTAPTTVVAEPVAETDVAVLAAFVEAQSGLEFGVVPEIEDATVARDDLGVDPGFFVEERVWNLFEPLGLVEPGDDRIAAGQARLDQVRGVCCPVLLFETDDHPLLESVVVVHELTHLIDRQRPFDREVESPEPFRFTTIVSEGNAQRVAFAYQAELEAAGALASRFELDWSDPRIPPAVLEVLELPYEEGAIFNAALFERGGLPLVEETFLRPPISTEQVLDPEAYVTDEQPLPVEAPALPGGVESTTGGTIGSFVLRLLAERTLDSTAAHELAISWAGDRYVLFERAGRRCVAATIVMDDVDAADALVDALRGAGVGAVVDRDDPTALTARRCATPAV